MWMYVFDGTRMACGHTSRVLSNFCKACSIIKRKGGKFQGLANWKTSKELSQQPFG